MDITLKIIEWYNRHKRDLPWRHTADPYRIWVSEIILQQTRVVQGMGYYLRFMDSFPTVEVLAKASQKEVLLLWQGLGYYSRARNMHAAAQQVVTEYDGIFPESYEELLKLKGVGPYTAAAIASFAFGQPYAAIDGNVNRVIARLFAVEEPINTPPGNKKITEITNELLDPQKAGTFNQAMMEFGALQCTPAKPVCDECPVRDVCVAYQMNSVTQYPKKTKKKKPRKRYLNYLVFQKRKSEKVWLQKRENSSDIWYNMYEFPLIESQQTMDAGQLINTQEFGRIAKNLKVVDLRLLNTKKHQLSHQTLFASFWLIEVVETGDSMILKNWIQEKQHNLVSYPLPRLISAFAEEYFDEDKNKSR